MAIIKIKGKEDPIILPYETAKKIKQRWTGDPTAVPPIEKAAKDTILDLGDAWTGTYGKIDTIELNDRPRSILPQTAYKPMTEEHRKRAREKIAEVGRELKAKGII